MKGVQETWKLLGAGSVGNQALLRIPCVARLRERPNLAAFSRVWPFETGFSASSFPATGPFVLHAEIWPGAMRPDNELHPVRDAAQVLSLARCLAEADDPRRVDHRGGLDSRRVGVTPETYLHLVNQPPSGSVDHR